MTSRNEPCSCGSGKKFKHCCGSSAIEDPYAHITDDQIRETLHAADDEGFSKGEEPKQRAFKNILGALKRLNIDGVVVAGANAPPIVQRLHAANNLLFRKQDQAVGGIHLGAIMFRDIFARFAVPLIFGSPTVDFFEILDLSGYQKKWLASNVVELGRFEDQSIDLMDFGYGWMEFGHGLSLPKLALEHIYRCHIHLEAAAATATGPCDSQGTIQSALLGSELSLKAGLAAHGISEDELKRDFRHDQKKAASKLAELELAFDGDRVLRVVATFPDYVTSRYAGPQPTRLQVGHVLMGAQYVASEVTRSFSDRDLRRDNSSQRPRVYPA